MVMEISATVSLPNDSKRGVKVPRLTPHYLFNLNSASIWKISTTNVALLYRETAHFCLSYSLIIISQSAIKHFLASQAIEVQREDGEAVARSPWRPKPLFPRVLTTFRASPKKALQSSTPDSTHWWMKASKPMLSTSSPAMVTSYIAMLTACKTSQQHHPSP